MAVTDYDKLTESQRRMAVLKAVDSIRDEEARKRGYGSWRDLMDQATETRTNMGRPDLSPLARDGRDINNAAFAVRRRLLNSNAQNTFDFRQMRDNPQAVRSAAALASQQYNRRLDEGIAGIPGIDIFNDPNRRQVVRDARQLEESPFGYRFRDRSGGNQAGGYIDILDAEGNPITSFAGFDTQETFRERVAPSLRAIGLTTSDLQNIMRDYANQYTFTDYLKSEIPDPNAFAQQYTALDAPLDLTIAERFLLPEQVQQSLYNQRRQQMIDEAPYRNFRSGVKNAEIIGRAINQYASSPDPDSLPYLEKARQRAQRLAEQTGIVLDLNTGDIVSAPNAPVLPGSRFAPTYAAPAYAAPTAANPAPTDVVSMSVPNIPPATLSPILAPGTFASETLLNDAPVFVQPTIRGIL